MAFHSVAALADLPLNEGVLTTVNGEPICLVRTGENQVKAVHNICSHQFYELHEGYVDDDTIECDLHGAIFDLDSGKPLCLPATRPVPTYTVRIQDGDVQVDSTPSNGAAPSRH